MPFKITVLQIYNIHAWHGYVFHYGMILDGKGKKNNKKVCSQCVFQTYFVLLIGSTPSLALHVRSLILFVYDNDRIYQ